MRDRPWAAEATAKALGRGRERRLRNGSWMAPCPCHEDRTPSLNLSDGEDRLLWFCYAGCDQGDVGRAIGEIMLGAKPLPYRPAPQRERLDGYPVTTRHELSLAPQLMRPGILYWYGMAEHGHQIFAVERSETEAGKTFTPWSLWRMDDGRFRWAPRRPHRPLPLYRLEHFVAAPGTDPVIVHEGEKAADAGRRLLGGVHLTWCGGVHAWNHTDWHVLRGRTVVFLPDNDDPGIRAAQEIGRHLRDWCRVAVAVPLQFRTGADIADADSPERIDTARSHIDEAVRRLGT